MGLSLIVMAAGMGSRYGGLKQIVPVGPAGEAIMDYSVYDAALAGFDHFVFIIKREFEELFKEKIGRRISRRLNVSYVCQDVSYLPPGFTVPAGREKPWGTGHAVLCCKDVVKTPFAVINADDYYGPAAFNALSGFLREAERARASRRYAMVGYALSNTVTESGQVARGICTFDADHHLINIEERTGIEKTPDGIRFTKDGAAFSLLPGDTTVSMNCWGFTADFLSALASRFPMFLIANAGNLLKCEYFLPNVVGELIREGRASVKVLPCLENWYGVTYQEDHKAVVAAIAGKISRGEYPADLWK